MKNSLKLLLTGIVVAVAVVVVATKYWYYVVNPWTRNGQVRAQVVQITPRVSGPIVNLPIKDNQPVKAGDVLFEIDPRTFNAALAQAEGNLDQIRDQISALEKQVESAQAVVNASAATVTQAEATLESLEPEIVKSRKELARQKKLLPQGGTSQRNVERAQATYDVNLDNERSAQAQVLAAQASLAQSQANLAKARADLGAEGEANAQIRTAKAQVEQATLNLEFTEVKASVDGYVTNLNLRLGSQAVANQPALALVDINSYWIVGFFRENHVGDIEEGDQAVVTLMTYADRPLLGKVESVGWGVAQDDGSTGQDLLPNINPTFEWIRLAQRVPVLVHLDEVPEDIKLRVGTTASVMVLTDTDGKELTAEMAVPAPKLLQ